MISRTSIAISALLFLLAISALGVIINGYQHRQLFIGLQGLQQQEYRLKVQFGRLMLEESTWSSPALIEQLATSQLSMIVPKSDQLIVAKKKELVVSLERASKKRDLSTAKIFAASTWSEKNKVAGEKLVN